LHTLQPVLDEAALLQLGPPKYKLTQLPGGPQQPANIARLQQQQQQQAAAGNPAAAAQLREQHLIEAAVAAAAAFRAVAAEASGMTGAAAAAAAAANGAASAEQQQQQQQYGPWQPFMAPLLVNQRVTSADHFQDTRHIEFDLQGSGFDYQPGDLLAVFPRTPAADVEVGLLLLLLLRWSQHVVCMYVVSCSVLCVVAFASSPQKDAGGCVLAVVASCRHTCPLRRDIACFVMLAAFFYRLRWRAWACVGTPGCALSQHSSSSSSMMKLARRHTAAVLCARQLPGLLCR
jgi:hypothetical protein